MIFHKPATEEEAATIVRAAKQAGHSLRIAGGGTRSDIGQAITPDATLSTEEMSGITLYEPSEMVLSAKAGTPLFKIQSALKENRQMLAFEPMDHRPLFGSTGEPTIGAIAAGNISGPRRIAGGAARDSLIGVRFVNGKGEIIKNGGRVMKNVTGLDLVKLQAGAWGTLGLLTEVTFKLLPAPEKQATLVLSGLDDETGVKALCAAAATPFEPTGLSHLPAGCGAPQARTLIRLEGFATQVDYRAARLTKILKPYGDTTRIEGKDHDELWCSIKNVEFLGSPRETAIWRLSARPTSAPNTVAVIQQAVDCSYFFDWSGGLIWLATNEDDDAGEETIRFAVNAADGHATLVRGSQSLRKHIDVFEPQPAPVAALSSGIKNSFDPGQVFNPGLIARR